MIKIILIIVSFVFSFNLFGQSDNLNGIFDQYQNTEGVTSIKIAKPMFKILNNLKIDNSELGKIQTLLKKVNGLKMLVVEKDIESNHYSQSKFENIEKQILKSVDNLKYEELVSLNKKDSKIKFLVKDSNADVLDNLILNITSDDSYVLMLLEGKITMDDISNMMAESENTSAINPISTLNQRDQNISGDRKVSAFNGVEISTGIKVLFSQNPSQSVVVKTEEDKQQYVITEVENGVLKLFIKNKGARNLSFNNLKVEVSNPRLLTVVAKSGGTFEAITPINESSLALSGSSGSMVTGTFNIEKNTAIEQSSGSNVRLNLDTKDLAVNISSGSFLRLIGNANSCIISASSGSSVSAIEFLTKSAVVSTSSGSNVKINSSESLRASSSSASSVRYKGNPKKLSISEEKASSSSIKSID